MSRDNSHGDSPEHSHLAPPGHEDHASHSSEEYEENSNEYSDITTASANIPPQQPPKKRRAHDRTHSQQNAEVIVTTEQQISLMVTASTPRSPQNDVGDLTSEDVSVNVDSAPIQRNHSELSIGEGLGIPHAISTPALTRLRNSHKNESSGNYSPVSVGSSGGETPIDTYTSQLSSGMGIEDSLSKLKNNTRHGLTEADAKK
jgi:hypothetical protein